MTEIQNQKGHNPASPNLRTFRLILQLEKTPGPWQAESTPWREALCDERQTSTRWFIFRATSRREITVETVQTFINQNAKEGEAVKTLKNLKWGLSSILSSMPR
jgi:hypothetical protein